jgi:RHS repeat-associated protein
VLAVTDASGTVTTSYTYAPFGTTIAQPGPSTNPFQYGGRENDGTGLYYYRARYYSPAFQRFVSEDPLGFGGGDANVYGYVYNNPITLVDPYGVDAMNWRPAPNRNVLVHGPRNGNWGGRHWAGGLTPPYYGPPAPPSDSGDECYMNHDNCWSECDACPSTRSVCMKACDRSLVRCARDLPMDPKQWARPPRPGTELASWGYRVGAIAIFDARK